MMLLLLLRHADAGVSDPAKWPDDGERPLTDVGRETQRRVSEALHRSGIKLDALYSSPLLRARQTASIVGEVFGTKTIDVCDALALKPDLAKIRACIGGGRDVQTVGLTGHSPWMDETASLLLGGAADAISIDFQKSGAMVIRADAIAAGAGQLIAFITPVMLPQEQIQP
jgi:phosphohistidine phosphatase